MNPKFRQAVESLHPNYERLIGATSYAEGSSLPEKGVYLFSKDGTNFYVGRSDNIPRRRLHHIRGSVNQAALAMLIARRVTSRPVDYSKGAKQRLLENGEFMEAFRRAQEDVRKMEFRAVAECDPTRQALLEVYCAIAANTQHNDFRNH